MMADIKALERKPASRLCFGNLSCFCHVVSMEMLWYPFQRLFTSSPYIQLFYSSECDIASYFEKCCVSVADFN